MPYIPPGLVAQAKEIDLLTYLQTYDPDELVHAGGGEYCTKTHDSLRISHGLWCWHSRDIGGKTALDYLIKVHGMGFTDAVEHLLGRAAIQPPVFLCRAQPPQKKALLLPPAAPSNDRALAYLQSRGIDRAVLERCVEDGQLYQSADYSNCVFVGKDKTGTPRYAALRGTFGSFKGEARGSDKRYSFSLPAQGESGTLHLFESAIDALSYATLLRMHGRDDRETHLLSMAGVFVSARYQAARLPVSLARYLEDCPGIERIDLHLDNDPAGRAAARSITDLLGESFDLRDHLPPDGCKDTNAYLQRRLSLSERRKERDGR